ncbi:MAG: N-acetyltransferase family protein [Opitutales bacterium]|nr:N-acetyltransferase family protein [Opitutales bacterium]
MIRPVNISDAEKIAEIYNYYIANSTATFETEILTVAEMQKRIEEISAEFPYYVFADNNDTVLGYCYAHRWKQSAAYAQTYETSVYVAHTAMGGKIGTKLMQKLLAECKSRPCHALVACITEGNAQSEKLHENFGFKKVSHFEQVGKKFGKYIGVADYLLIL